MEDEEDLVVLTKGRGHSTTHIDLIGASQPVGVSAVAQPDPWKNRGAPCPQNQI